MSDTHSIDPARVQWRDAAGGRAGSPLLVLMHGLGSHEHDLFSLAPALPSAYTIASLRAPLRYGDGFAWTEPGMDADPGAALLGASVRGVLEWLDEHATEFTAVGLMGFSQGGLMTLQLARAAPERFAFLVQLSGFVHPGVMPGDRELAAMEPRIPALQAWGTNDTIIPRVATERTSAWMREHLDAEQHEYAMAHEVTAAELRDVVRFVEAQLEG